MKYSFIWSMSMESMMAGWPTMPGTQKEGDTAAEPQEESEDLSEIRKQLASLEAKLSKMGR